MKWDTKANPFNPLLVCLDDGRHKNDIPLHFSEIRCISENERMDNSPTIKLISSMSQLVYVMGI